MKYNSLHNTKLNVSEISLGTWVLGGEGWGGASENESVETVHKAIDLGINMIDTAPIYGYGMAEKIIGKALKGKRNEVILATKCGLKLEGKMIVNNLQPQSIREEIEQSLSRLQTDYIDLYQCHWPDRKTPIEETMRTMAQIQKEGKIRYLGVSNFDAELMEKARSITDIVTLQSQYSMLERSVEKNILSYTQNNNIGFLAYGVLGGGILTGKYEKPVSFNKFDARKFFYKYYDGQVFNKVRELINQLKAFDKPLNQISINWVRQQAGVTSVLVGCRRPDQLERNVASVFWTLSGNDIRVINQCLEKHYALATK